MSGSGVDAACPPICACVHQQDTQTNLATPPLTIVIFWRFLFLPIITYHHPPSFYLIITHFYTASPLVNSATMLASDIPPDVW